MLRWQLIDTILCLRSHVSRFIDDHFWQYKGIRAEPRQYKPKPASIQFWPPDPPDPPAP